MSNTLRRGYVTLFSYTSSKNNAFAKKARNRAIRRGDDLRGNLRKTRKTFRIEYESKKVRLRECILRDGEKYLRFGGELPFFYYCS